MGGARLPLSPCGVPGGEGERVGPHPLPLGLWHHGVGRAVVGGRGDPCYARWHRPFHGQRALSPEAEGVLRVGRGRQGDVGGIGTGDADGPRILGVRGGDGDEGRVADEGGRRGPGGQGVGGVQRCNTLGVLRVRWRGRAAVGQRHLVGGVRVERRRRHGSRGRGGGEGTAH